MSNGQFIPYLPSKNVFIKSQQITKEIREVDPTYKDPLPEAMSVIGNIRGDLFNLSLDTDEGLPDIINPLKITLGSELLGAAQLPFQQLGFLGEGNVTGVPTTVDTPYDQLKSIDQKIDRINKVDSLI